MTFEEMIEAGKHRPPPEPFRESDSVSEFEMREKIIESCRKMYQQFDMTAREICHVYDCEFKPEYNKLFYTLFGAKGKGHGGSRRLTNQKSLSFNSIKKVS